MSDYCTVANVQKYIAVLDVDTESSPTTEQTEEIITDLSAEIDFVLQGLGYKLPIPDTGAEIEVAFLKKLIAVGTAGYVVLSMLAADEYRLGVGSYAFKYINLFNKYYERIQKMEYKFPNLEAETGTPAAGLWGKPVCNYDSTDIPIFEKEDIDDFKEDYEIELV